MPASSSPTVLLVMGVSGVGKTTVGEAVAERLGWAFFDADDFHPPANVAKMERGEGLTDADRGPWLAVLGALVEDRVERGEPAVLACSALKRSYREHLRADDPRVAVAWLDAPVAVLHERLTGRAGHFAGVDLLPSQRSTLEPPPPSEAACIDATQPAPAAAAAIIEALNLEPT